MIFFLFVLPGISSGGARDNPLTLAYVESSGITLAFIDGKQTDNIIDGKVYEVLYSGEDYRTISIRTNDRIYILRDGRTVYSGKSTSGFSVYGAAVSASGNVAFMESETTLCLYDVNKNEKTVISAGEEINTVCISHDGQSVLYSNYIIVHLNSGNVPTDNAVYLYNRGSRNIVGYGVAVAVSDNGEYVHYIAFSAEDQRSGDWGYTIKDSSGRKILSGIISYFSIVTNKDFTEVLIGYSDYGGAKRFTEGVYHFSCRTNELKYISDFDGSRFYPADNIPTSTFSMYEFLNYTRSESFEGMLFRALPGSGLYYCGENYVMRPIDNGGGKYKFNDAAGSLYYIYHDRKNSADSLYYISDVTSAFPVLVAENTGYFGVLPDGSGAYYADESMNLYLTDKNGGKTFIDSSANVDGHIRPLDGIIIDHFAYIVGNGTLVYYSDRDNALYAYHNGQKTPLQGYTADEMHAYRGKGYFEIGIIYNGSVKTGNPFLNMQYLPLYKELPDGRTEVALLDENANLTVIGTY